MIHSLSDIAVFSQLSSEELKSLSSLAHPTEFSYTEELPFRDNNGEYSFYVLTSGHAKVIYQKHDFFPVRVCGPGDILGYGEWNSKYSHRAESLDDVRAWRFSRIPFQKLLHSSPNIQECMIKVLCDILSNKDERISALENHSVSNRVASVLLSFSQKFGKETQEGLRIDLKIDRETMAKLAGTVTESLSRQLSELEEEEIILRKGRSILIKNRPMLELKTRI